MKSYLRVTAAGIALAIASPAAADIVIYDGVEYGIGETINIDFAGTDSDGFDGLSASLSLTLTEIDANGDYVFAYALANTATDPDQADSEVSAFGFDVDPNITGATEDGPLTVSSGSISNGVNVEFCLTAGPNCAGGGSGGDEVGGDGFEGFFTLLLAGDTDPGMITISDLTTRFQVTGPDGEGSGIGTPTNPVPEPATWAMMLMGFGAAGYAIRRRRRTTDLAQLA